MNLDKLKKIIKDYGLFYLLLFGLFLIGVRFIIIYVIGQSFNITSKSVMYPLWDFATCIFLFAFWIYVCFKSIRQRRYKLLTGRNFEQDSKDFNKTYSYLTKFYTTCDEYAMDLDDLPITNWLESEGAILCKVKDENGNYHLLRKSSSASGNLITFGRPECGKSTTQAATTAIAYNKDISPDGCGVFAISIKGDLLKFIDGRRNNVKVFTPDNAQGSCHFDPLHGVMEMDWTQRKAFAENMAVMVCPEEGGENAEFFYKGARDCFSGVLLYLLHLHDTEIKTKIKFKEITDMVLKNDGFDLLLDIRDCGSDEPGEYTNGYIGSNDKNFAGIWSHLNQCIRPFNNGALRELLDNEGDCITPEYLNEGDIYIDVPQHKYQIYAPCMAIIVTTFIQSFMERDDVATRKNLVPIIFLLDEFPQLHMDFSILSTAMATLRSKKVSIFLLLQSLAQLEGTYGETHSREIIDLCKYISVFNVQDPRSRDYFQKLIGRKKVLKRSTSLSTTSNENKSNTSGISVSEEKEYIFEPSDFGGFNIKGKRSEDTIYRALVYVDKYYVIGETIHYSEGAESDKSSTDSSSQESGKEEDIIIDFRYLWNKLIKLIKKED